MNLLSLLPRLMHRQAVQVSRRLRRISYVLASGQDTFALFLPFEFKRIVESQAALEYADANFASAVIRE